MMIDWYQYTCEMNVIELNENTPQKPACFYGYCPLEGKFNDSRPEYLSMDEVCRLTGLAKQSIYNLISKKVLEEGKHFFKPTGGKLLFKWSEIVGWIEKGDNDQVVTKESDKDSSWNRQNGYSQSNINI